MAGELYTWGLEHSRMWAIHLLLLLLLSCDTHDTASHVPQFNLPYTTEVAVTTRDREREREGRLHTIAAKLDCNVRRIGIAKRHNCPGSTSRAHFPIDDCSTTDSFHLFIPVYGCCLSASTTRSQLKLKLFYSRIYPFNVPSGATFIGGTHALSHTHRARCTLHNAAQRTMHFLYNFSCRAFYLRSH